MARLVNVNTGAVVQVPDEKAARLGSEWLPKQAEAAPAKKAAPRKRTAKPEK